MAYTAREIWTAQEGSIKINSTDHSAEVKEISVTGGMRDVDQVRTFGGQAVAGTKMPEIYETQVTFVKKDNTFPMLVGSPNPDSSLIPSKYPLNYEWYGSDSTVGSPFLKINFSSAYVTQHTMRIATDGHMEETVNFKCLAKDYNEDYTE